MADRNTGGVSYGVDIGGSKIELVACDAALRIEHRQRIDTPRDGYDDFLDAFHSAATARWEEFVPWLRSGPGQLVGTSLKTTHDYLEPVYEQPCFLLIGNESQGLPDAYEAECDLLVKMPMLGKADSLNAAVATAVMAYEVINQWRR